MVGLRGVSGLVCTALCLFAYATGTAAQSSLSPGYAEGDAQLTAEARAGKEIWFFATAFNDRFFTYSYPQRLGAAIDWYSIFAAEKKGDIFPAWGGIPDPDCCVPGSAQCPAKSLEETFGFQWCPGDDALLSFVGKEGYRDPACSFKDAPFNASTPHGTADNRQDPCDLRFGTSTGVLGLRKFPNPRFDAEAWKTLNGSLASWEGYRKTLSDDGTDADSRVNRLFDGSIEPPFRIGMACGACHISYDPANPPADPNAPRWSNIDGLVGNQYSRISNLLGSGLSKHRLEWQLVARARPGIVDTSALAMDFVSNPGTMNAVINFAKRPLHEQKILKWRKVSACAAGSDERACWCEPGKPGKCWERSLMSERVPGILKGGEDAIGVNEGIQRVYFNIGSCAEQCWVNHIPDMRAADPSRRNYGQTPFDIGQCRRDCASFRAIEDRLDEVKAFFLTARPSDLWKARKLPSPAALEAELDREFFPGAVAQGRAVFARECARCHSSEPGPHETVDFTATDPADPTLRIDWLGNDEPTLASEVGTYAARSLHSNHMPSRVWGQYAPLSLWERAADPERKEVMRGSGRGYYRNISLLSVWAHAPFMHNNAIGPEICGKPADKVYDFYSSPYVDANGAPLADPPACRPYDVSVEGRYALYKDSMRDLLNPDRRIPKTNLLDEDLIIDIAPKFNLGDISTGLSLRIPKGYPAVAINSLRFKDLAQDLVLAHRNPEKLDEKYGKLLTAEQLADLRKGLDGIVAYLLTQDGPAVLELAEDRNRFVQTYYSNLFDRIENAGHRFGEGLSQRDKDALTAFLATL